MIQKGGQEVSHGTTTVRRPAIMIAVVLSFTLLLSACGGSVETDLTLYTGDRYEATSRLSVPAASLTLIGGAQAIESSLKQMEQKVKAEGATFSWRKENAKSANEVVYRIATSGAGYDRLTSDYNIRVQKVQWEGKDALSVSASPSADLYGTQSTLRLHVGKILQTDNQRSGANIIVWTGSEALQAVVTPASRTKWLVILLVILAVAALAAIVWVFLRRRPAGQVATASTAMPIIRTGAFCPHCGQQVQPGAKFCMSCGEVVPPRSG
jgi:hypothetical protein